MAVRQRLTVLAPDNALVPLRSADRSSMGDWDPPQKRTAPARSGGVLCVPASGAAAMCVAHFDVGFCGVIA